MSTKRQGESGLGLEGQQAAVEAFAGQRGAKIVASYTEIESGKRADRPALTQAIGHAKLARATLVVAKLGRLARNVAFLSSLMESGVEFVACDNEHANRLTVHILAAVAEDDARRISDRTKAALAAAKRRGVKLGSARAGHWDGREHRRGWQKAAAAAAKLRTSRALEVYAFLLPTIRGLRAEGASLRSIADRLNLEGHSTAAGKPWTATAVLRVLRRE